MYNNPETEVQGDQYFTKKVYHGMDHHIVHVQPYCTCYSYTTVRV